MTSMLTRNLTDEEVEAFERDGVVVATGLVAPPAARAEVPPALCDVAARLLDADEVWAGADAEPAPGWVEVPCAARAGSATGPDHVLVLAVLDAIAAGRPLRLMAGTYRWRERAPEAGRPAVVRWYPEVGDVLAVRAGTFRHGPVGVDGVVSRAARSAHTAASRASAALRSVARSSSAATDATTSR